MKVGYVLGTYPRATDTFIQREIAGVRASGVQVETFAVRRPVARDLVDAEQIVEHDRTSYVLPVSGTEVVGAQTFFLHHHPRRWFETVRLAAKARAPGTRSTMLQAAYMAEAAIIGRRAMMVGIDHLHNHFGDQSATVTMLAARLAGLPFSMTIHGSGIFFEPARAALGLKADEATFVACISDFTRSQVMLFASRDTWSRLHVIHCGVDPRLFEDPRPGVPDRFRVLSVGRLAVEKGLPVLISALRRSGIPGVELWLVGDGPDRSALEALAREYEVSVSFLGSRSQSEVRELLRDADALASTGFAEGIPTALMEAMAARVPVVATRVAGVPELVDERCGRLVRPGNESDLARALKEIHGLNEAERRALGTNGRQRVSDSFDITIESEKLAHLFIESQRLRAIGSVT